MPLLSNPNMGAEGHVRRGRRRRGQIDSEQEKFSSTQTLEEDSSLQNFAESPQSAGKTSASIPSINPDDVVSDNFLNEQLRDKVEISYSASAPESGNKLFNNEVPSHPTSYISSIGDAYEMPVEENEPELDAESEVEQQEETESSNLDTFLAMLSDKSKVDNRVDASDTLLEDKAVVDDSIQDDTLVVDDNTSDSLFDDFSQLDSYIADIAEPNSFELNFVDDDVDEPEQSETPVVDVTNFVEESVEQTELNENADTELIQNYSEPQIVTNEDSISNKQEIIEDNTLEPELVDEVSTDTSELAEEQKFYDDSIILNNSDTEEPDTTDDDSDTSSFVLDFLNNHSTEEEQEPEYDTYEQDYEEEYEEPVTKKVKKQKQPKKIKLHKEHKKVSSKILISGIAVALTLVGGGGFALYSHTNKPAPAPIPSVQPTEQAHKIDYVGDLTSALAQLTGGKAYHISTSKNGATTDIYALPDNKFATGTIAVNGKSGQIQINNNTVYVKGNKEFMQALGLKGTTNLWLRLPNDFNNLNLLSANTIINSYKIVDTPNITDNGFYTASDGSTLLINGGVLKDMQIHGLGVNIEKADLKKVNTKMNMGKIATVNKKGNSLEIKNPEPPKPAAPAPAPNQGGNVPQYTPPAYNPPAYTPPAYTPPSQPKPPKSNDPVTDVLDDYNHQLNRPRG